MALHRQGGDITESEQEEFLEDHGFLIDTNKSMCGPNTCTYLERTVHTHSSCVSMPACRHSLLHPVVHLTHLTIDFLKLTTAPIAYPLLLYPSAVSSIIDPDASMTMEYLDMIMSIKSNNWKVLLVPTARLEFRITEFSWRDIPYFMYKRVRHVHPCRQVPVPNSPLCAHPVGMDASLRQDPVAAAHISNHFVLCEIQSEITAQGTRDYLAAKWKVRFPNTGFWAFIKYVGPPVHAPCRLRAC